MSWNKICSITIFNIWNNINTYCKIFIAYTWYAKNYLDAEFHLYSQNWKIFNERIYKTFTIWIAKYFFFVHIIQFILIKHTWCLKKKSTELYMENKINIVNWRMIFLLIFQLILLSMNDSLRWTLSSWCQLFRKWARQDLFTLSW